MIKVAKDRLISEVFSLKMGRNHDPEHSPPIREDGQGCDLAPISGDLSQKEKLSKIKLPLTTFDEHAYFQRGHVRSTLH